MATKDTPTPTPAPAEPPKAPEVASNGKQILIVEDERPLSHALEMKLKNQGFATTVVTNGQDAIKTLGAGKFDMMLLDLIMPVMDGFAVLEEIQKQKLGVKVIVLSNLGQDEDRTKAKALGAIDYFVKSNTPIGDIVEKVKSNLK